MITKYSFLQRTAHASGRISEVTLVRTHDTKKARSLRLRISAAAGKTVNLRTCKRVAVSAVDAGLFRLFSDAKPPQPGQIFESIDAMATRMETPSVTLRSALSRSRKDRKREAVVRGVTYGYVV